MDISTLDLQNAAAWYKKLGIDTLPLFPNTKVPIYKSWPTLLPDDMWRFQKANSNIGLRAGGDKCVAFIDCDEKHIVGTYDNIVRYLNGIGVKEGTYPVVKSASGIGRHIYIRLDGYLPGQYRHLSSDFGAGEFRYGSGSMVVGCPSTVDGNCYQWINNNFEQLPFIRVADIIPLLKNQTTEEIPMIAAPPVRLVHRDIPRDVIQLFKELAYGRKGEPIAKYESRSNAEAAVVSKLILAGWTYQEISDVFVSYQPGKYREENGRAESYLERTYSRTLSFLASSSTRKEIASLWQLASNAKWLGGSGILDRDVYMALLSICWQCNSWTVRASERDIAQYVAGTRTGVHNALDRLQTEYHSVRCHTGWGKEDREYAHANKWELIPLKKLPDAIASVLLESHENEQSEQPDPEIIGLQELWSPNKLGRAAGVVYQLLGPQLTSVAELERKTAKSWSTVKSALERLEKSTLAIHQVEGWMLTGENIIGFAAKHDIEPAEVWSRKYLGKMSGIIYPLLNQQPVNAVKLAKLTGKCIVAVKTALKQLEKHGLVQFQSEGWKIGTGTLSELAKNLDLAGVARKRASDFQKEREKWQNYHRPVQESGAI